MNRTAGLYLIIALSIVLVEQSTSHAQHHARNHVQHHHRVAHATQKHLNPVQRVGRTVKSTVQQVAHKVGISPVSHSSAAQGSYCPTCQQNHAHSSHAVRVPQSHSAPSFKRRTVNRIAKTQKSFGSKYRKFSKYLYIQNQQFRTRNMMQSIALFSDKELLNNRNACPECMTGKPHYLANNHLPKYPHAEPFQVEGGYSTFEQSGTVAAALPEKHKSHFKLALNDEVQGHQKRRHAKHQTSKQSAIIKAPHGRRQLVKTTLVPVSDTRPRLDVPVARRAVPLDQADEFKLPVKRTR